VFALPLLLAGCGGNDSADHSRSFPPATLAKIETAIDDTMRENNIPGAVIGIYFPGEGTYEVAKGFRNRDTKEPMRLDDHFRVGSNTKAFTGTVILQLVDEGKITLDQKVGTILDGVPNGDKISVRNLLNMTSGIPNYSDTDAFNDWLWNDHQSFLTVQQLLDWGYSSENTFQPGEQYEYSNTNTVLLGKIIAQKTGMSVAEAFQQRLYAPLGMTETSWPKTGVMPEPFARGYTDDTADRHQVDATNFNPSWSNSAGQLVSNLQDMRIWARSLGTGSLISPQMQAERLTWVTAANAPSYYGLAIGKSGGWLHHQGELPGYNTIAAYLPQKDAVIVVLCNANIPWDQAGPAARLTKAISDVLAPEYSPGVPQPPDEN
jgi:D-alanyl-D-alanine carboxypeptidase